MSTPASITKMIQWMQANLSTLVYSESDSRRLSNVLTDPTDCSGLARRMYSVFAGIQIGTYTGNEDDHGWEITATKAIAERGENMLPGDLIFYRWENRSLGGDPWDHVNIFAGGDLVYNHGGPGKGPVRQSLRANVNDAVAIMVRRIIAPVTPPIIVKPVPKPTPTPAPQEDLMLIVRFPDDTSNGKTSQEAQYLVTDGGLVWITPTDSTGLGHPVPHDITPHASSNIYKLAVVGSNPRKP